MITESLDSSAELFLKYNYVEVKEITLRFITIVISLLVFSVAFSEKIIDIKNSTKSQKRILIWSWAFFILSIIFCGVGFVIHSLAGGQAVYGDIDKMYYYAQNAYRIIVISGILFIFGLVMIIMSGIKFLYTRHH